MARYSTILRDQNEVPISGAVVSVINPATGALATLTDDLGASILNPITTGALGDVTFNAADNVYRLEYRINGTERRIDDVIVGSPSAFAGPAGPAFATYFTLATFKAAATSNATQILQDPSIAFGTFYWETANAPYTADNVNVIKADSTALSVGAWVRQRETVDLRTFLTGAADSTAAFNAAITSLGANGGVIEVPAGDYKANLLIDHDNITLRGKGGRGEFDTVVIRPYSLASPTIRVSDAVGVHRYVTLESLHVSGSDGTASSALVAHNAPAALQLDGGAVSVTTRQCVFYNGVKTINMVPSAGEPVTVYNDFGSTIRNDITDSTNARCLYGKRLAADGAYLTAITFFGTKFNTATTTTGYAVEIDGSVLSWAANFIACYFDIRAAHGILLKGGATIRSYGSQLDPGASGVVVVETDQAIAMGGIDSYITGNLIADGQKFKFSDVTIDIPSGSVDFTKGALTGLPYIGTAFYMTLPAAPYSQEVRCLLSGTTGNYTVTWSGAGHVFPTLSVTSAIRVAGVQVVSTRDTGWTAMTGTGSKGALAAAAAGTTSAGYVQAEAQAALNRIAAIEARLKSYDGALTTHGLIGA